MLLRESVTAARALPLDPKRSSKLVEKLLAVAGNLERPAEVRLSALAAVPGGLREVKPDTFDFLIARMDRDKPVVERSLAADVISRSKLSTDQLIGLTQSFGKVGPMELDRLLEAFTRSTDEGVGLKLLSAIERSPVRAGLRVDSIRTRRCRSTTPGSRKAGRRAVREAGRRPGQAEGAPGEDARLAEDRRRPPRTGGLQQRQGGVLGVSRTIGYLGGKIGPDLTHIGKIRVERDLLEAIIFPSASFVRSYEPVQVTTTRGKIHNGLMRKDSPEEVVLTTSATEEVRIPRKEIEDIQPSKVSIMPAGMDKVLSAQELADLVALLRACK